jgi:hypothetical protein
MVLFGSLLYIVAQAFVFSKIWNWYVVPFFHTGHMPIVIAFGIVLMVELTTLDASKYRAIDSDGLGSVLIENFEMLTTAFCLAWIGTFFI